MILKRLALVLFVCDVGIASPPAERSRGKIEAFKNFLESTKSRDGKYFLIRSSENPLANPEENSGGYQGDIILDDWMIQRMVKQYAAGRSAYTMPRSFWPDKVVVWEFGEDEFDLDQKAAIRAAIKEIEDHSCVRFRYREPADNVFVRVTGGPEGCLAHVGYCAPRGVHMLNVARNQTGLGCFRRGNLVHEWLHTLGLLHMHSTYDRDEYVRIYVENVTPGLEHNFAVFTPDMVSNLGVEYDYISIMHYGEYAFSENGKKTVEALKLENPLKTFVYDVAGSIPAENNAQATSGKETAILCQYMMTMLMWIWTKFADTTWENLRFRVSKVEGFSNSRASSRKMQKIRYYLIYL